MATHSSIPAWRIPKDRGVLWATVHGVAKSWTRLSDKHTHTRDYVLGLVARGTVMSLGDLMSALTQHTDGGKDSCGVDNGTTEQSSFKKDTYVCVCVCVYVIFLISSPFILCF